MNNFIHNLLRYGKRTSIPHLIPAEEKTTPHSMLLKRAVIHHPSRFRISGSISHPLKKRYEEREAKKQMKHAD
jgi:hypothetical protein